MNTISLQRTPKRIELIKRMADSNKLIAAEAQEAFAAFISPVIQTVLLQKVVSNSIYTTVEFSENDRPTIPIDLYLNTGENYIRTWSQTVPGGLPTNVVQGTQEYTFTVFPLDSAITFDKSYAKQARLDVVTAGMERMINEIGVKQDRNGWTVLLTALAQAVSPVDGSSNVIAATKAGQFSIDDISRLWTKIARMYESYIGGTPATTVPVGLTDLFVSPEVMGNVRGFAYNPVNVRGGYTSNGTETTQPSVALPDNMRNNIFNSGGMAEIFNVTLHQMVEFGTGQIWNKIYDNAYAGSFDPATQQIAVGFDLTRPVFLKPTVVEDENGGQVVVKPDDQYVTRSEKIGYWARTRQGYCVLDSRALTGVII